MADGPFYVDTRLPDIVATPPAVTLTTSPQILASGAYLPQLPANYFNYVGKTVRVRVQGQATSGTTPGAFIFVWTYGPATSNSGIQLCGSSMVWTASVTNGTFISEIIIRCRAIGVSGSLYAVGTALLQNSGIILLPGTSPAAVAADLTGSNYITPQASRNGSTAETIQMFDYVFEALN